MRGRWRGTVKEAFVSAVIAFVIIAAIFMVAAVQALSVPAIASISQPAIWIAGVAASVGMALYLLRAHPLIRRAQPW